MVSRVTLLALVMISRYVAADCSNGASEGWDQCTHGCLCTYEVVTCEGGGWYTHYFLDKQCTGGGTGGGATSGSGAGSGSGGGGAHTPKAPKQQCDMMNKWLDEEKKFLAAYKRDDLLDIAQSRGWSPSEYDALIDRATHPTLDPSKANGGAVMWTNPRTCQVMNVDAGCKWLLSKGLPPVACTIAKAHEEVHAAQCRAAKGDPSYDPGDLQGKREREVEAHTDTVNEIENWLANNC
jgi:hypothetical protein